MQQEARVKEAIELVADMIVASQCMVVFTGAGISTESGIPDFRGPDGIWTKVDPSQFTFQRYLNDAEMRRQIWETFLVGGRWPQAEPNAAHIAIAELERLGKLDCLITQNVDSLHLAAGNSEDLILELHGASRYVKCIDCGKRFSREQALPIVEKDKVNPKCDACGGLLKSGTVAFGEPMPARETREAERRARSCDLFLVIGSSLVVYPAAFMPVYALQAGARVVVINLEPTPVDDRAHAVIHGKAGELMPLIMERVRDKMEGDQ